MEALIGLGISYNNSEKYTLADSILSAAIEIDNNSYYAYLNRSMARFELNIEDACKDLHKANKLSDNELHETIKLFCK